MPYGISVRDAMTTHPVTCTPELSIHDAVKLMVEHHVGSLLVVKDSELLGVFTEKDILTKIILPGKDSSKVTLGNIMTTNIFSLGPEADISNAADLMVKKDIRRVPVLENGKLVGLVTEKDLLRISPSIIETLVLKKQIKEITRKPVKVKNVQGHCDVCENFSDELIPFNDGFICPDCFDSAS